MKKKSISIKNYIIYVSIYAGFMVFCFSGVISEVVLAENEAAQGDLSNTAKFSCKGVKSQIIIDDMDDFFDRDGNLSDKYCNGCGTVQNLDITPYTSEGEAFTILFSGDSENLKKEVQKRLTKGSVSVFWDKNKKDIYLNFSEAMPLINQEGDIEILRGFREDTQSKQYKLLNGCKPHISETGLNNKNGGLNDSASACTKVKWYAQTDPMIDSVTSNSYFLSNGDVNPGNLGAQIEFQDSYFNLIYKSDFGADVSRSISDYVLDLEAQLDSGDVVYSFENDELTMYFTEEPFVSGSRVEYIHGLSLGSKIGTTIISACINNNGEEIGTTSLSKKKSVSATSPKKNNPSLDSTKPILTTDLESKAAESENTPINTTKSKISIERYVSGVQANLNCYGTTGHHMDLDLNIIKKSKSLHSNEFRGTIEQCFEKTGDYFVSLQGEYIDGTILNKNFEINIVAALASEEHSKFLVDCDQDPVDDGLQHPIANGDDFCKASIEIRDRFNNSIDRAGLEIVFEDAGGNKLDANSETSFSDGLQVANLKIEKNKINFNITSVVPSLHLFGEEIACRDSRTINMVIRIPTVNAWGEIQDTFQEIKAPFVFRFDPMYLVQPTMPEWIVFPGPLAIENDNIFVNKISSIDPVNSFYTTTPESIHDYQSVNINHIEAKAKTYGYQMKNIEEKVSTNVAEPPLEAHPMHVLIRTAFVLDGKKVAYPAGYLGGEPKKIESLGINSEEICEEMLGEIEEFPFRLVGAYVENEFSAFSESKYLDRIGSKKHGALNVISRNMGINAIRSNIRKSVWDYTRTTPEFCPTSGVAVIETEKELFELFDMRNVAYFEDCEVVIGPSVVPLLSDTFSAPRGRRSLLIRNGNLKLNTNLFYQHLNDSFGVILFNDDEEEVPVNGNVLVHPKVQRVVGTFFLSGALMGYNGDISPLNNKGKLNKIILENKEEKSLMNDHQLVLEGNIISHNTLGGYLAKRNEMYSDAEYFTPWSISAEKDLAILYDLHYVRRFDDLNNLDYCSRDPKGMCDPNNMAFVIRNDMRARQDPPPGFEISKSHSLISD